MANKRALPLILTLPKPGESMKRGEDGVDTVETFEFDMYVYIDPIQTIPLICNLAQFRQQGKQTEGTTEILQLVNQWEER